MANLPTIGQFVSQPTSFILSKLRFQRNYLWDVVMPDIGTIAGLNVHGLEGLAIGQLVQSVQFGDYSMDSPTVMRVGPYQASFAGMLTVDKIQMTFLKTQPDAVSAYFNSWKKLIVDDQGLFQPKSKYQKTLYIRFLDSSGIAFGRYKLIGVFPTRFPVYQQLDYNENSVTKILIGFTVDKIEYNFL